MSVPAFPSQDLAKLVLGYLAEEQLMTAYDEFLQASPFLDAMKNEYDRIFMTSLRNILAEYRAIKIFIETCKPFALRSKLFQCNNLLEVVKLLVNYIDLKKLYNEKPNSENISISAENRLTKNKSPKNCDICKSLRLNSCACKTIEPDETESLNLVETTALADLPGNYVTSRKNLKSVEGEVKLSKSSFSRNSSELNYNQVNVSCYDTSRIGQTFSSLSSSNNTPIVKSNNSLSAEPQDNSHNRCQKHSTHENATVSNTLSTKVPLAGGFQEFSSGVSDCHNVPASNTSLSLKQTFMSIEDTNSQHNITEEVDNTPKTLIVRVKKNKCKTQITDKTPCEIVGNFDNANTPGLKTKTNEQKITILSDIRMENSTNSGYTMPKMIKNATSTPLVPLQTIVINGTPAFKPQPPFSSNINYTKDEIMAMPTIILVPNTGTKNVPVITQNIQPQDTNVISDDHKDISLSPLTIDITTHNPSSDKENTVIPNASSIDLPRIVTEPDLITTVESMSLPKDNLLESSNTPQVLPPTRKSSSTPRRNSHIRVLDFTTPRRILHETINEVVITENNSSPTRTTGEVLISRSPQVDYSVSENNIISKKTNEMSAGTKNIESVTSIKSKKNKSHNWDADLRALVTGNDINRTQEKSTPSMKNDKSSRVKKKTSAKKIKVKTDKIEKEDKKQKDYKVKTDRKNMKNKNKQKLLVDIKTTEKISTEAGQVPIKPTINIVSADDWNNSSIKEPEKKQKPQLDDKNDTPEADRVSLQNAIGVKLNLSDLLETPYKQALYDIQMETPKFIDTGIISANTPFSDIKIMNIPTPRFFESPVLTSKPTPSSYSSRPTDYSSGGSYYKPDDQDYSPIMDNFEIQKPCQVSENSTVIEERPNQAKNKEKANSNKARRPVRQCTKNVSYYSSPSVKSTLHDVKEITESSPCNGAINKTQTSNSDQDNSSDLEHKNKSKIENKKRFNTVKRKSPLKKEFIKIKSKPTPQKKYWTGKIKGRFTEPQSLSKTHRRKTINKDKGILLATSALPSPTKSRRKSSTPRKLHCTKVLDSDHLLNSNSMGPKTSNPNDPVTIVESFAIKSPTWSAEEAEEISSKSRINSSLNEIEDISKIQDYLQKELVKPSVIVPSVNISDKMFDSETAKIIERDLIDTPPHNKEKDIDVELKQIEEKFKEACKANTEESANVTEEEDVDVIELSVHDCGEESCNYKQFEYEDGAKTSLEPVKLKDKFSMEVCIDDGIAIRLRATEYNSLFQLSSHEFENEVLSNKETENAVNSISCNFEKLYTPMKESISAQCYAIFDSTLTSLDTPLKTSSVSPKRSDREAETTMTEIILEVEQIVDDKLEIRDKCINKAKRKRVQSATGSDDNPVDSKRSKKEAKFLLNSASIQNMDIESVLSKLHGP